MFVDEIHSQHVVKRQVQRPVMPHKGTLQINQKKKEIKEKRKRREREEKEKEKKRKRKRK